MATGTVTNVYPKGPTKSGKNGPGAVVFSDGAKFSTFSDADLSTAKGLIGQLAEYAVETKGQYTNLAGIKAASNSASGPQPEPRGIDFGAKLGAEALVAAIKENAAALREMAAEYRKVAAGIFAPPIQAPGEAPIVLKTTVDPVPGMQSKLAAVVGDDAADAMFSAIKKRHGKSPEKLQAAAAELLKLHDIGAAA